MNQHNPQRDEDRDAWLAQALRHAPDANADAPTALSNSILREARAAAASAAPVKAGDVGPPRWLALAWDWLVRPPVAAGFASVMVATLVGVMWWGRPLDESLPRAPEVVSQAPPARAEAAPEAQAIPEEKVAPKLADASRESAARGRSADKKEAENSARASRPAAEPPRQRSAADAAPAVATATPPPVAFPAAAPAPAPQAAAPANEAQAPLAERRERAAPAAKAAADASGAVAADTAASPRNDIRALQGSASPVLAKARAADSGDAPLATLRARIAQQPERWGWQRGNGTPQPMNAAVQAWLAELDARAASRWQTGVGSLARAPAGSLRLFRDGALEATLGFTGSAVWIETPGASAPAASAATLPEAAAESLRNALDQATP